MDQEDQRQVEQRLIEGLFAKLRQAEIASDPHDRAAEHQIAAALHRQPSAPYCMA
jgi:hypothetical protein